MDYRKKILSDYKTLLLRLKNEREYIEELFEYTTIRLICFKYAYYVSDKDLVNDNQYDIEEFNWYLIGRAIGKLRNDETTPCVGFDENHPMTKKGIELHDRLPAKKKSRASK